MIRADRGHRATEYPKNSSCYRTWWERFAIDLPRPRGSPCEYGCMWTCPKCSRRFGRSNQGHECAPAMTIDDYFAAGGPPFERGVFEAVCGHLQSLDPDLWVEPVSVGIFFKRRTSFVQLRTMTKWVAVCFHLPRRLTSDRLSRRVVPNGQRFYHVVNARSADDVDGQLRGWLTEAWEADVL